MCPIGSRTALHPTPKWHIPVRGVCGLLRSAPGDPWNVGFWHMAEQSPCGVECAPGAHSSVLTRGSGFDPKAVMGCSGFLRRTLPHRPLVSLCAVSCFDGLVESRI